MINSLFNNAKEKINDVADAASDKPQTQVFDQIKEAGSDKIRDTWQQIKNASEVLQKTGYRITSLEIDIAMPPTISMDLNHKKEVDEATIQKLIDEYKRDKVINALLLTLQQGDKMQKSMQMATFVFNGIGMEIGLAIPHMKLKFKRI